ncbi:protein of unknown function [Acidithiobacillus ferrivorans]|nr:protein of unknown function [Acidithiobacillus ferrivorans]
MPQNSMTALYWFKKAAVQDYNPLNGRFGLAKMAAPVNHKTKV